MLDLSCHDGWVPLRCDFWTSTSALCHTYRKFVLRSGLRRYIRELHRDCSFSRTLQDSIFFCGFVWLGGRAHVAHHSSLKAKLVWCWFDFKKLQHNNCLLITAVLLEMSAEDKAKNPMRTLQVDKLIINCCVGESGDRLTRAAKVLEQLTDKKPVYSKGINAFIFSLL